MLNWFLTGFGWFASSAVGGFATYLYTRHHEEAKDRKKSRNKLTATCHSVCFCLAMQQSELGGLLKDIEYRIVQLKDVESGMVTRDKMVTVLQDFPFYKDLGVNIKNISEVLLFAGNDQRGIAEILQSIFISNKKYFKVLNTLERFNEAKRLMDKEDDANLTRQNLLQFANTNLPQYKIEIEQNMRFISQSLEAFKATIKEKFNITVNLSVGELVKLN